MSDSQNIELLKKNGITHIINATPDAPIQNEKEFRSIRIPVLDLPSQNIQRHFEKTIEFIDEAMSSKENKVLVHCAAGISRSPTLVLAYMIKKYHLSLDEAVKKMRKLRSIIDPNLSFMEQLRCWEKQCRLGNEVADEVRTIKTSSCLPFSTPRSNSRSRCVNSTQTNTGETQARPDASIIVK